MCLLFAFRARMQQQATRNKELDATRGIAVKNKRNIVRFAERRADRQTVEDGWGMLVMLRLSLIYS